MIWPLIHTTPIRLQQNPVECGAMVLGMVLDYYGSQVSSHTLNALVGVSRHGTDAASLIEAAHHVGLAARAKKVLLGDLKHRQPPSILFVDNCHFVVLEGYSWGRFYINDPALGRYSLSADELRRRLSGVQIVLKPEPEFVTRAKEHMGPDGLTLSTMPWCLLGTMMGVAILGLAMSLGLNLAEQSAWLGLGPVVLTMVVGLGMLFFMHAHLDAAHERSRICCEWLLANISRAPSSFFTTRPYTNFSSTIKYLSQIGWIGGSDRYRCIALTTAILVIIVALTLISWPFAVIAFILCVVVVGLHPKAVQSFVGQPLRQYFDHYPDLAAMGQNQRLVSQQMALSVKNQLLPKPIIDQLCAYVPLCMGLLLIFCVGGGHIQAGLLSTRELYASLILVAVLCSLTAMLAGALKDPASHQTHAFLAELAEHSNPDLVQSQLPVSTNLLEIRDGYFIYPGESNPVLSGFNLSIEAKKIYGLKAGPMAGTSTLLKLLGQKLSWTQGGHLSRVSKLRVALIDDEADLFEGTLLENIRLFDRHLTEHEVVDALERACIVELFYNRPMGLLAPIYAGGTNVSGGQKKRLLLARALIQKPDLLLLDNFFETLEPPLALKILGHLRDNGHSVVFTSDRPAEQELCHHLITLGEGP